MKILFFENMTLGKTNFWEKVGTLGIGFFQKKSTLGK